MAQLTPLTPLQEAAIAALEPLRLAPIFALMHTEYEGGFIPPDFKPEKWFGFEEDHAEQAVAAFRGLIEALQAEGLGTPKE